MVALTVVGVVLGNPFRWDVRDHNQLWLMASLSIMIVNETVLYNNRIQQYNAKILLKCETWSTHSIKILRTSRFNLVLQTYFFTAFFSYWLKTLAPWIWNISKAEDRLHATSTPHSRFPKRVFAIIELRTASLCWDLNCQNTDIFLRHVLKGESRKNILLAPYLRRANEINIKVKKR